MAYWLAKTEPEEFSYDDLEQKGREPWSGVRNAAAQKHMRAMQEGDLVMIYHTGKQRAIVGVAKVVGAPFPDPTAAPEIKWVAVDVAPVYRFSMPVTLASIKADPTFAEWALVRQSRLSVMPVSVEYWRLIHEMGETGANLGIGPKDFTSE
jgi:predicted RNA-binding protein with PUA-like domain